MDNHHLNHNNLRLHERYRCRYPAKIYFRHQLLDDALVENLSLEGLLLTMPKHELQPGSIIDIIFESTAAHTTIEAPAFVVHSEPDKIGVWLDDEDKILKNLIQTMIDDLIA